MRFLVDAALLLYVLAAVFSHNIFLIKTSPRSKTVRIDILKFLAQGRALVRDLRHAALRVVVALLSDQVVLHQDLAQCVVRLLLLLARWLYIFRT